MPRASALATASLMAREGAKVVVADIDGEAAADIVAKIGGVAVSADVSRVSDWGAVVEAARPLGGPDVVHLNAGVTTGQTDLLLLEDEQYRRIMGVNVDGVVFGVRALLPELETKGGGSIVVTASLAGLFAFSVDPVYTLTKHAVVGLVRALARPGREACHDQRDLSCHRRHSPHRRGGSATRWAARRSRS